ncbi:MAG: hypothetical protein M1834_008359 [Cirrosporium novae-zelandiae]|nr:MAG: hypothetical protein M1834_008359 [Cirrosporium novae-zelandiae]
MGDPQQPASLPQEQSLGGAPVYGANAMNQTQPYMDMHSSHMSTAQSYPPQSTTAGTMQQHYQQYQQPPVLQPSSAYPGPPSAYSQYSSYGNGTTSPQTALQQPSASMTQLHPLPGELLASNANTNALAAMTTAPSLAYAGPGQPTPGYSARAFDPTGQTGPPGVKPRVTATLWEDEGTLCFQVEARGVCVARREDNHFVNGTKLLNVAQMTRGRRDGILKSEKTRTVVKIGPMHLKGVWIPYERALEFANKEKITEDLYPLFVYNIGALLYQPQNQAPGLRPGGTRSITDRQKLEAQSQPVRPGQSTQPPTLHHHHSMSNSISSQVSQPSNALVPAGRPGIDRAHTFPTPPTSASSTLTMNNQSSSYEWGGQSMSGNVQGSQPLSIDTGLSNARSMPATPATTPPGNNIQGMQPYQGQQAYDASRTMYTAPPPQPAQYAAHQNVTTQNIARYGQPMPASYVKTEMAPPTRSTTGAENEQVQEPKTEPYVHTQANDQLDHGVGEPPADHATEPDYLHDNSATYSNTRSSYNYNAAPSLASLQGEPQHLSPELTNSPSHQNGSGRVTPRTQSTSQSQWNTDYQTPPRIPGASNLYSITSDTRGSAANGNSVDAYPTQNLNGTTSSVYPSPLNGSLAGSKRLREDDDQSSRLVTDDYDAIKRRKTIREGSVGGPVGGIAAGTYSRDASGALNRSKSTIVPRRR